MPQLDAAAYLNQVFWLILVFFTFYLIVLKNILPALSRILKVRTKKAIMASEGANNLTDERVATIESYDAMISKTARETVQLTNTSVEKSQQWVSSNKKELTTGNTEGNKAYMNAIYTVAAKRALIISMCA